MQLYVRVKPDLPAGGPYANMNPGNGHPFGVIEFGDDAYVSVKSDDEARRIIAAAAALIEMRKAIGTPHEFEPSPAGSVISYSNCARCGMLEDSADHAEPVITDSGRTCDQANPGTGAWCHRDGDHAEHRDTDGETWRTDGAVEFTSDSRLVKTAACTQPEYHGAGLLGGKPNMPVLCDRPEHHAPASVTGGEDRCECSHPQDEHDDEDGSDAGPGRRDCLRGGCGCGRFRRVVPSPHAGPPAVVSSDVVLEVRALLP